MRPSSPAVSTSTAGTAPCRRPDVRTGAREALFSKPPSGQPPARSLPPSPSESLISCLVSPASSPQPNLSAVSSSPRRVSGSRPAWAPPSTFSLLFSWSPPALRGQPGPWASSPEETHCPQTGFGVPGPLPPLLICPSPPRESPGPAPPPTQPPSDAAHRALCSHVEGICV